MALRAGDEVIIAGDFNDVPESMALRRLTEARWHIEVTKSYCCGT
jgi:endonuclease/exonuclease/phosphatase (EEP) superfamily protein YafD